jgi:hypothetical protein
MRKRPINQVLAGNLAHYMRLREFASQPALAAASHVAQRTISNYLRPDLRQESKSGKEPSAKLTELEKIASALKIDVWQLLVDGPVAIKAEPADAPEAVMLHSFRLLPPEAQKYLLDEAARLVMGDALTPPASDERPEEVGPLAGTNALRIARESTRLAQEGRLAPKSRSHPAKAADQPNGQPTPRKRKRSAGTRGA